MKSAVLYYVYPVNHWRELTQELLSNVPHDSIYICVSLQWYEFLFRRRQIRLSLAEIPKVKKIVFVRNSKRFGEVSGFDKLRTCIQTSDYTVATYMHGKGVTKPGNKNIKDWVELMRYFLIDRFQDCLVAFQKRYALYGVNLGVFDNVSEKNGPYKFSGFHYSGNFVSVNLAVIGDTFFSTPCDKDYFGVEGFWGKLCDVDKAFCAHMSSTSIKNHYTERYPAENYKPYAKS